jgi:hypothetical protein
MSSPALRYARSKFLVAPVIGYGKPDASVDIRSSVLQSQERPNDYGGVPFQVIDFARDDIRHNS